MRPVNIFIFPELALMQKRLLTTALKVHREIDVLLAPVPLHIPSGYGVDDAECNQN
jgi:hypothetical protein